jgi:hypothetical protein
MATKPTDDIEGNMAREIVIRIQVPKAPLRVWLVAVGAVALLVSAIVFAATWPANHTGQKLSASDIDSYLNDLHTPAHLVTGAGRPSATLGASPVIVGGSGASVTVQSGGDGAFLVELVTGSSTPTGAGSVFSIAPTTNWGSVPFCTISGANVNWVRTTSGGASSIYYDRSGSTVSSLNFALFYNGLSASSTYDYVIICVQN